MERDHVEFGVAVRGVPGDVVGVGEEQIAAMRFKEGQKVLFVLIAAGAVIPFSFVEHLVDHVGV